MENTKPLSDIRVLAIESYGAGPWATLQLADMGAEIIKIETPGEGDVSRVIPPGAKDGDSLFYQCLNRNKKSITLDLRSPRGPEVLYRLIPAVDVLFANLKGDVPEKMGLTYEHLQKYNPKLVCCFLTGFGRTGPRKTHPGYDYLIQSLSGIAWMGGEPDGPPARCGVSVVDMAAGTNTALLILAGIHHARSTGRGLNCDTSLLELGISYLNYLATWNLSAGYLPKKKPFGAHQTIVPSQFFATADGWLMVMGQKDKFYRILVKEMGRPELAEDPRFLTMADRYENRESLLEILTDAFKEKTTRQWMDLLEGKAPVAPVNNIPDALQEPQVEALDMIVGYDHPSLGYLKQVGPPFKFSGYQPEFQPGSALGADTDEILSQLAGYAPEEITNLRQAKTI